MISNMILVGPRSIELFSGFTITSEDVFADIGCGYGQNCIAAGKVGATVLAVDRNLDVIEALDAVMRDVPARAFHKHLAMSDDIPLESNIATKITCTEVLEHVDDPVHFTRELARIGARGAEYMISVPDHASEMVIKAVAPPDAFEYPNHVRIFGRDEFKALIQGVGLIVTDVKFIGFYWSIYWALLFASGSHFGSDPVPDVLRKWEETWAALCSTPTGQRGAASLDLGLAKSQIIFARKP